MRSVEAVALVAMLLSVPIQAQGEETWWRGVPPWLDRFRLSGNADVSYLNGGRHSLAKGGRADVENLRLFLDTELAEDLRIAGFPLVGDTSVYVEWDSFRERTFLNQVGSLYLRLDRLFGVEALNLKAGRVLIPFGEEYVRFSEQRPQNPLISFSAPAPYGWDEGVLLFGAFPRAHLQYVAALTTNDPELDPDEARAPQGTAKIGWGPAPWAHLSLSGTRSASFGTSANPAETTLEFGGEIAPVGEEADTPTFQHGRPVPEDPSGRITLTAGEADAVLTAGDWGRLWLAVGRVAIGSGASSRYDRDLTYGIAEGIFGLGRLSPRLDRLYLAARYSTIGTFDDDRGYRFEAMNEGEDLGFNTKSVSIVSVGLGLRLGRHVTLKTEYSWYQFALVRGVPRAIRAATDDRDYVGVGASFGF